MLKGRMSSVKNSIKKCVGLLIGNIAKSGLDKIQYEARKAYCNIDPSAFWVMPECCGCPSKIVMEERTCIYKGSTFIMSSTDLDKGRFIMKKGAAAAQGLTVVTLAESATPVVGKWMEDVSDSGKSYVDRDIIVHEDVWIGANVTLLYGAEIGRGSIIGAGSVVRKKIPPYSIVMGNPAKIVSFVFTPEEILEHERILYKEEERLPFEILKHNYEKYYLNRIKEINSYIRL